MDPITHTLTGAALGEAGLKERTPLAMATLLVGANLPDVDVLWYAWGEVAALQFRRGWTHGVLAMVVLPVVLTGVMLAWDRQVRRRRRAALPPARAHALLLLSFAAVLTHPFLDFLNTYGMRFLMPFSGRWFYGDALFIADAWVWLALGAGVLFARRWRRTGRKRPHRPARIALGVVAVYVVLMLAANVAARRVIAAEVRASGLPAPRALMVAPVPVDPFRRHVLLDVGTRYVEGRFQWLRGPQLVLEAGGVEKGVAAGDPTLVAALQTRDAKGFLSWARFPFFRVEARAGGSLVRISDLRYSVDGEESWATVTVLVPPQSRTGGEGAREP